MMERGAPAFGFTLPRLTRRGRGPYTSAPPV